VVSHGRHGGSPWWHQLLPSHWSRLAWVAWALGGVFGALEGWAMLQHGGRWPDALALALTLAALMAGVIWVGVGRLRGDRRRLRRALPPGSLWAQNVSLRTLLKACGGIGRRR
jgi:hypothetical protein